MKKLTLPDLAALKSLRWGEGEQPGHKIVSSLVRRGFVRVVGGAPFLSEEGLHALKLAEAE